MANFFRTFSRRGFSLIEVLIAMLFLSVVILGLMWMNSFSTRGSNDAYFDFTASQLALEPIEVFRSFGYEWLTTYGGSHYLLDYPLETWIDIESGGGRPGIARSGDAALFKRTISVVPVAGPPRAMRVTVQVAPRNQSRASTWLMRDVVTMNGLIVERPK